MSLFLLRYHSAFDIKRTPKGKTPPISETTLCAPANWDADEVADAYENQNPGACVISCCADPLPKSA